MSDRDTDIETKEKSTHLVIPSVVREDAGEYVVTLSNEVGTEKVPIKVIVKGKSIPVYLACVRTELKMQ